MARSIPEREAAQDLRARAREMRDDGTAFVRAAQAAADDLAELSRAGLERSPYLVLGAAFSAGYVLGGGLPLRVASLLAGVGMRVALSSFVEGALVGSARASADADD